MTATEFGPTVRRRRDRVSPAAAGPRREELALLAGIGAGGGRYGRGAEPGSAASAATAGTRDRFDVTA